VFDASAYSSTTSSGLATRSHDTSDWILANPFDDEAGKLIAVAYHEQHSTEPSPEHLTKEWEQRQALGYKLPDDIDTTAIQHSTRYHPPSSIPSPDHVRSSLN